MRVVIVDDEPLARSRLVHLCQEHAGVEVVAQAASGADAIEVIKAHRPDLVLLDAPTRIHLAYRPGVPLVRRVWKDGVAIG